MRTGDIARDRKPKPGPAFILVAGGVKPNERLEHFFALIGRYARAVVIDMDRQKTLVPHRLYENMLAMALRIANEIGNAAFERVRAQ